MRHHLFGANLSPLKMPLLPWVALYHNAPMLTIAITHLTFHDLSGERKAAAGEADGCGRTKKQTRILTGQEKY